MRKIAFICGLIVLAVLFLLLGYYLSNKISQPDPFADINLPIYPTADVQSIRQGFDKSTGCKYVSYKVSIKFPAKEVIEFYNKRLDGMNFKKYFEDDYGNKGWENFSYRSGRWEPTQDVPARFLATWVNEQKNKRVLLDLFYRYDGSHPQWKEDLLVECKVCNFFDFRNYDKEKFEQESGKNRSRKR